MSARDELLHYIGEDSTESNAMVDAFRAEVLREGLAAPERAFLTFALDLASDRMASRGDEFTADDHTALDLLRRMAAEAGEPRA